MRYVIYGAGGIGGGIGAQLHLNGFEVLLIARGEHLQEIQAHGLHVLTPDSEHHLEIPAVGGPDEIEWAGKGGDVVFFTMKSQDTVPALSDLRAAADDGVSVVCAQNGVANERMAARRFPRIYGLLVHMPATFLEPGTIRIEGSPIRGVLDGGCYPRGTDLLIEQVCSDLETAGFSSQASDDVMSLKYGKLLMNLGNAVQALCGLEADIAALTKTLRREAMACFNAAGIEFTTARDLVARRASRYHLGEIEGAARQGGSTWQSLVRGSSSIEADFLNGEICLLGIEHRVPTPFNRAVQELANAAALKARAPGSTSVSSIERRAAEIASSSS